VGTAAGAAPAAGADPLIVAGGIALLLIAVVARNGVRYQCWDQAAGSVCSFQSGPTVGVGFAPGNDLDQLSRLTDEARRGVHA
jgi:hypothetical protein